MCGIGGIVALGGTQVDRSELERLNVLQAHRGPDGHGTWVSSDGSTGLAHRRLAVIDPVVRADQPMVDASGRVAISYNGEIYNFRELRAELERCGHRFRSNSDTEVLLAGYLEWGGPALLSRLRGMYAFLVADGRDRSCFFARDPLGIKPLYFSLDEHRLVVASEVPAVRSLQPSRSIDELAVRDYLLWGSIAAPRTLFAGIQALEAGGSGLLRDGVLQLSGGEHLSDAPFLHPDRHLGDPEEARHAAIEAIRESVQAHLVADVEVGAFLSAGVDSTVLLSLASAHVDEAMTAITVRNPDLDESPLAAQVASLLGVKHTVVDLDLTAASHELSAAVLALGQPTVDGVNTYFVSQAAAQAGLKVALSGVGGDELFGGYASFRSTPLLERADRPLSPLRRSGVGRMLGAPGGRSKGERLEKLRWALAYGGTDAGRYLLARGIFAPHETAELTGCGVDGILALVDERIGPMLPGQSTPDRVTALEAGQYLRHQLLRDTDAASMTHSLEVRTPLVDHRLYHALRALSGGQRTAGPAKQLLRQAATSGLPDEIWQRPKTGFSLPFERWLRSGIVQLERPRHPLLDAAAVDRVFSGFDAGKLHWSRPWSLHVLAHHL